MSVNFFTWLNALRGGDVYWTVQITHNGGNYTFIDNVISVENIHKEVFFDGHFVSNTVHIKLYGLDAASENDIIKVSCGDKIHGLAPVWTGKIKNITKEADRVFVIEAAGMLSFADQDLTVYYPRSGDSRGLYNLLLRDFLPEGWRVIGLGYTDDYYRQQAKFSTKYSTLAGLSGIAEYKNSDFGGAYTISSLDFFTLQNWQVAADFKKSRSALPKDPLVWHAANNNYLHLSGVFADSQTEVTGDWSAGVDAYMRVDMAGGGSSSFALQPSIISRQGDDQVYQPDVTRTSWGGSYLYPDAKIQDTITFNLECGTAVSGLVYGEASEIQLFGDLIYKHNYASARTGAPTYFSQDLYPVTIMADDFTFEMLGQLAMLGSFCIFENAKYNCGYVYADLCPESGAIFPIPLISATVSDVSYIEEIPLPKIANVNFRTPINENFTYQVSIDPTGEGEIEVDVCQGQLQASSKNYYVNQSFSEYSLCGKLWDENPGFLVDRWPGVTLDARTNEAIFSYFSGGENVPLALQNESGQVCYLNENFYGTAYCDTDHCVTSKINVKYYDFCLFGRIRPVDSNGDGYVLPAGKQPWLNIFPILQYKKANDRCFPYGRHKWKAQASLAFAHAEPGTVILVNLTEISDEPWLALVVSQDLSSSNNFVELQFMPMYPAAEANAEKWADLAEIISFSVMPQNKISAGFIPAKLLTPVTYNHRLILNNCSVISSAGAYVLSYQNNVNFMLNPNDTVHVSLTNKINGAVYHYDITTADWDYAPNSSQGRVATNKNINNLIFGSDSGLYLRQSVFDNQHSIIGFDAYPFAFSDWEIVFDWNDAEAPNYFETLINYTRTSFASGIYQTTSTVYNVDYARVSAYNYTDILVRFLSPTTVEYCTGSAKYYGSYGGIANVQFYTSLPAEGVYTEIRPMIEDTSPSGTSTCRCVIASSFRSNYPESSAFASTYFNSDGSLKPGCALQFCVIVRGF